VTAVLPCCVNETLGLALRASALANVTVRVWPTRTLVAERATEKASTTTVRVRTVVPSALVACTRRV